MPAATATDVVEMLLSLDPHSSMLVEDAVLWALRQMGLSEYEALYWVDERQLRAVRFHLDKRQPQDLPFDISLTKPLRLIGKSRPRSSDTPTAKKIRERRELREPLAAVLSEIGDNEFEHVCAALMLRVGALDVGVTAHGDDGGIDFYGRIGVLVGDPNVPSGLVRTTLDVQPVLFLGQAKRYQPSSAIGRPALQQFAGQVRDCLTMYRGMATPPSHRVPDDYYTADEVCLPFFLTTAGFSKDARDYARSVNMILGDGKLLAELLIYWGFGSSGLVSVDAASVVAWIQSIATARPFADPA